ncbi:MAG: hypothetical protein M3P51_02440 [Chloroflexota bacterium]|nr:hypothetical protein [Chloroflexota bacterium]
MATILSEDQRAHVEQRAWELRAQGVTQARIATLLAEDLGVEISQPTVSRALSRTRRQVQKALADRAEQEALLQLSQLDHVQYEAMTQWERSKQDAQETITTMSSPDDDGEGSGGISQTTKAKGQTGDPRLLQRAMEAMEGRRRILGIDAPSKQEVSGAVQTVSLTLDQWKQQAGQRREQVEQVMAAFEDGDGE